MGETCRPIDRQVYENELKPWLPERIIDCHTHVSLAENCGPISPERRALLWPVDVGFAQSWDELRSNYALLFPEQVVEALVFGGVLREQNIERENETVLSGLNNPGNHAKGLFVTRPEYGPEVIAGALDSGFLGVKPYPDLAPSGDPEVSIYEFLPPAQLELLNERHAIVMLHIPRAGRLAEADNIREILEISERYPSIKLIVAHIGRAYCLPTAEKGLRHFADTPGVYFDTSANLNADVFQLALETIGPERILYGTDLPVMMMRGVREHVGEKYINYTDGDYSWNTNRKSPAEEADYTFYAYEELRALIEAVQRTGLGKEAFHRILYHNAARLLAAG